MANKFADTIAAADMTAYLTALNCIRDLHGMIDYTMLSGEEKRREFSERITASIVTDFRRLMGVNPEVEYDAYRNMLAREAFLPITEQGHRVSLEALIEAHKENFNLQFFSMLLSQPVYNLLSQLYPEQPAQAPQQPQAPQQAQP